MKILNLDECVSPLNVDSPYPIVVKDKGVWFTLFAYIQSVKYKGTQLEQKIKDIQQPSIIRWLIQPQKIYNEAKRCNEWGVEFEGIVVFPNPDFDEYVTTKRAVEYRLKKYVFMKRMLLEYDSVIDTKNKIHERVLNEFIANNKTVNKVGNNNGEEKK